MMDANSFTPALENAMTPTLPHSLTQSVPTAMDPTLVVALTCLVATTLVVFALLRGWQDWLALKNRELENLATGPQAETESPQLSVGAARIELADMKERIKKLEAIASGVEL
ncbi:MAG: hypothetical protein AAF291_17165 [Pseudomonadota bacterium]